MNLTPLLLSRLQFAFTISYHIIFPSLSLACLAPGVFLLDGDGGARDDYVHHLQPAKFAAIEARWHDEQPAGEVLIAWPDAKAESKRPYFVVLPIVMGISIVWCLRGVRRHIDSYPIRAAALMFLAAFAAFGVSFWPYVIPFSLTFAAAAAAPPSSLRFMFWGAGLFVLPLTIIYTGFDYRMFAGKVAEAGGYE
jgi:cytochrome bd-type quinol oxidase subunit 2